MILRFCRICCVVIAAKLLVYQTNAAEWLKKLNLKRNIRHGSDYYQEGNTYVEMTEINNEKWVQTMSEDSMLLF